MKLDRGNGHVRLGGLLLTWNARTFPGSPLVHGCRTVLRHDDGRREDFGGLCAHWPRSSRAVSVGLLGHQGPSSYRWHWLAVRARVRWVLAGCPRSEPGISVGSGDLSDGEVPPNWEQDPPDADDFDECGTPEAPAVEPSDKGER